MRKEEIISLWKEKNVDHVDFTFDCGGDSMGDTDITILNKDGEEIQVPEIDEYINEVIYDKVDFYVNSDGHYIGENGVVIIELDEDDLTFSKDATSEFSETFTEDTTVELSKEEAEFVANHIGNINGDDNNEAVLYKHDFIITDEDEARAKNIVDKIRDTAEGFCLKAIEDESGGWFTFTTGEGDIKLSDNMLTISVSKQGYVYKESD